ncbi:uncharacterized protein B0H18DRAFT_1034727 [Fomitopsis serialis]|uniref:uncharacterized protein n=1 Tax=Fomitopsis serialis TaxID=139415 RepID=UPI0020089F14|nr:uncharacterized protein B0H18DRAFT_1034727 [Neoantrodia serialis]KAH9917448.1 hypothetical protein B0H18DRAFT_1034727 [Neoantrodia serialis]
MSARTAFTLTRLVYFSGVTTGMCPRRALCSRPHYLLGVGSEQWGAWQATSRLWTAIRIMGDAAANASLAGHGCRSCHVWPCSRRGRCGR